MFERQRQPRMQRPMFARTFTVLLIASILAVAAQALMTSSGITSNPSKVQTKKAAIRFWSTPGLTIPANNTVSLTVPDGVVLYTTGLTCRNMIDPSNGCSVIMQAEKRTFVVTTFVTLAAYNQFQFEIGNAIDNPDSTKPTLPWGLTTQPGEQDIEGVILVAETGNLATFTLQPRSTVVGDATDLTVSFKTQSIIPLGSYIFLTFPKWNPEAPADIQKTFIQGSQTCKPIRALAASVTCDFQNDQLILSSGSATAIAAGEEITFSVSGFKNPISTLKVSGFQLYTAIKSGTVFYKIDVGSSTLQVTDYAQLSQVSLRVRYPDDPNAGIVQELNQMQLSFFLPVPLNAGCKVTVQLPPQYNVTDVKKVYPSKVFGEYTEMSLDAGKLTVNEASNSFFLYPCSTYIPNVQEATIFIDGLRQYKFEKQTDSLKIFIDQRDGSKIADIENGVTFLPKRGTISTTAVATDRTVQAATKLTFQLKPKHAIYVADAPLIVLEFPSEIGVGAIEISNVYMSDGVTSQLAVNPSYTHYGSQITLKDWLPSDYVPSVNNSMTIYFTIGELINPISTFKIDGMKVTINAQGLFAIDQYVGVIPWNLQTGKFNSVSVSPQTDVAYHDNEQYSFRFNPQHSIPKLGYIEIHIPAMVTIPDLSYTQSSCVASTLSGFSTTQISCEFVIPAGADQTQAVTSDSQTSTFYILRILNAFRRSEGPKDVQYMITLPGIRNPIQTLQTPSFKFITYTKEGYSIDLQDTGASIQMTRSAQLADVELSLDDYQNSQETIYNFMIVPTVPIKQTNRLAIKFPEQITLPRQIYCDKSNSDLLIDTLKCEYSQVLNRTVLLDFTFAAGVKQINALDRFLVKLFYLTNPVSTQPTDSIEISFVDQNLVAINSKLTGIFVTTNMPYPVSKASVSTSSPAPYIEATFTLKFTPRHNIQVKGGILIIYPPQTTPSDSKPIDVEVTVTGRSVEPNPLSIQVDLSARSIKVSNIIQGTAGQGGFEASEMLNKEIQVKVTGLRNPYYNDPTDSFQLTTFNYVSDNFYYYIDSVTQGLVINSDCSYPCKTCAKDSPDKCLSCYDSSVVQNGLPFLQLETCVEKCATSRYYDKETLQCELCGPKCLECKDTANTCTACGVDNWLYLLNKDCKSVCPMGYLENSKTNMCDNCAFNCKDCENGPSICTLCDEGGKYPYFFRNDCTDQCPPNTSVLVGTSCVECDSTCKTCLGTPNHCTSCDSHMRFDQKKNTCTQMCEFETQIFIPETLTCEYCQQNCTTCAGSTTSCTSCKPGYVLNLDLTCKPECSAPDQTPLDGVCKQCESPCFACRELPSRCSSCRDNYKLLRGEQCVQYCPEKYAEVTAVPPNPDYCMYEGLVCPLGFEVNKSNDGCIPIDFDCEEGKEINEKKTACVPKPGSPVPFPFILASVFLSFLVLGSYLKDKFFTKVLTCLIALIGCFEVPMYALMFGYSVANIGTIEYVEIVTAFSCFGCIFMMISNAGFLYFFRRDILAQDQVFGKWLGFFPKTKRLIPICILLVNFKTIKILYSGFYGMESTMAKFGDCNQFHKIMRMITYASFAFSYSCIFLADIVIFVQIKWGFQLFILGIETFVLQFLIIILTVFEFRIPPQTLLNVGGEYSLIKPNSAGNIKVMGGLEDDDYEEGVPDMDETTLIRSRYVHEEREINLRKNALVKILNAFGGNLGPCSHKGAEIGADLDDCMTKFDSEQLRFRRAFSMSDMGDDQSWQADGQSANLEKDPYGEELDLEEENEMKLDRELILQRRYSFPLMTRDLAVVPNTAFAKQINQIQEAAQDYLLDNVYADTRKPETARTQKKKKTVSRRTQTYLRELLQMEGEDLQESDMEILMEDEAEIDEDYTAKLINNVIDGVSDDDSSMPPGRHKGKKGKKKPQFRPRKQIPDFELTDIMGEFEIDDLGNFIIMRGPRGELLDRKDRKVNRRGYLVDRFGNVINTQGNVIFKAVELDVDDEIPAPFGFEKRKKNLLRLNEENEQFHAEASNQEPYQAVEQSQLSQKNQVQSAFDTEELLEKELQEIRNQNRQYYGGTRSDREDDKSAEDIGNIDANHENSMIDRVTRQKVPKKKDKLKKPIPNKNQAGKLNNVPPRRIKAEDTKELFPTIGVDTTEQKRLHKIAGSISGMAAHLAEQNKGFQLQEAFATQQHQTLQQLNSRMDGVDAERLDRIKQEHLRDIIADADFSQVNKTDVLNSNNMLQQRPPSQGLPQGRRFNTSFAKPQSAAENKRGHSTEGKRQNGVRVSSSNRIDNGSSLQRVYGNIGDFQGFEEQALADLIQQRRPSPTASADRQRTRGMSGDHTRMKSLENVYMSKQSKNKSGNVYPPSKNQASKNARSHVDAFRPMMQQFKDDPSELNVHTEMDGLSHGDRSLAIAERLDNMQRQYLNNSNSMQAQMVAAQARNQTAQIQFSGHDLNFRSVRDGSHNRLDAKAQTSTGFGHSGADVLEPVRKGNWVNNK